MKKSTHKSGAWRPFAYNRRIFSTNIIMRIQLLFLIMLMAAMHASGSAKGQSVTLSVKKTPLVKVFDQIETQTGYYFNYKTETVDDLTLTIELQNVTLQQALDACFKNLPITYKISERVIIVKRKAQQNGQEAPEATRIPPVTITGTITNEKGEPFPGVTVRVKRTDIGTVTDEQGRYSIMANRGATLVFTYIGYQPNEVLITNGQTEISFALLENPNQLKETVIKGYYTTTKELNTGTVTSVKAQDIKRQPVSDPLLALQGRVPGLVVQQLSGVPGRQVRIRLRGQNSLENGNDPLFIIDGIQVTSNSMNSVSNSLPLSAGGVASPFNYLNPADIESIEILKDADATALYGSRGANGVILISTKKGATGKTQVDARVYSGMGKADRRVNFMDNVEYLKTRRQAFLNDNAQVELYDYDLNGTWDTTRNMDWQKYFIGNSAPLTEASLSISGGNQHTVFRIGSTYRDEKTIFPGDFSAAKTAVQLSLDHHALNDKLTISINTSYLNSTNKIPTFGIEKYITVSPVAPKLYNEDGSINWENSTWENPLGPLQKSAKEVAKNLISNFNISYNIIGGLSFKSSFGYNKTDFNQVNLTPWASYDPSTTFITAADGRSHEILNSKIESWIVEPQLAFTSKLIFGKLDALIGMSLQSTSSDYLGLIAYGFNSDATLRSFAAGSSINSVGAMSSEYKYQALYARLGYSLGDKYVLNLTGRRDGSSRFGPARRFGNFGAIGAAWIFSKEPFAKNNFPWLSLGKIRSSYGTTGNDQIGDYNFLDTYVVYATQYQNNTSMTPTQLTNPLYGWERVNKLELGLELGFIANRLSINFDYYRNRTKNQLVLYGLPSVAGFPNVRANLPAVVQNSGFEIGIDCINIDSKRFSWSTNVNLTIPKNKLVSYPNLEASTYARKFVVGEPINSLSFLYEYTGKDSNTGLYTFTDLNNDGKITTAFDRLPYFIGQKYYGGIQNNIKFDRFELDFLFQFTKQNGNAYIMNGVPGLMNGGLGNQPIVSDFTEAIPPYTQANTDIINGISLLNSSNGTLSDASFIRLKNTSLSYQINMGQRLQRFVKSGKIFLLSQNLFTITKYNGFDPERPLNGVIIPPLKMFTAGINATF
ncbi:SusC/RagA family TonB-linked outer membrane protein [uncultured Chitinophaga sp.]|uniref:SusC/RagA family TonB-linked outer membrane protein n=1 Tax=uncultured Chitinophaga sp. TaxID=339340 RepID=UPI0025D179C2|nr:SusC/RagA family TonB-linked outer membrane protein [uncultured Chitinophaga sp.]